MCMVPTKKSQVKLRTLIKGLSNYILIDPCCVGVLCMFAVISGRRLFSSDFAITERRDMGLYEIPLSMSL